MKRSIGVIKLSALGDVIWTISLLKQLEIEFPEDQITLLTDEIFIPLLEQFELKCTYIPFKKPRAFSDYITTIKKLKSFSFDILLCAQSSLRINILYPFIKSPLKIGLEKGRGSDFQSLFIHTRPKVSLDTKNLHQIHPLINMINAIDQKKIDISLRPLTLPTTTKKPQIIIHPMASHLDRTPHVKFWRGLITNLQEEYPQYKIILTGAKKDLSFCHEIAKDLSIQDLSGKTNLVELHHLYKNSSLVIAPDTGPIHLASATLTHTIGLYAAVPSSYTGPIFHLDLVIDKYGKLYEKKYGSPPLSPEKKWPPKRLYGEDLRDAFDAKEVISMIQKRELLTPSTI